MKDIPDQEIWTQMRELTGIERIGNISQRKPVDRIGLFEHFWSDTQTVWAEQGHIQPGENLADHFGFIVAFIVLGWLGMQPATPLLTKMAQFFSLVYFGFFVVLYVTSKNEKTKPVPERVTK